MKSETDETRRNRKPSKQRRFQSQVKSRMDPLIGIVDFVCSIDLEKRSYLSWAKAVET